MIGRDELRRAMELEGYDLETINKVLAWYYETPVSPVKLPKNSPITKSRRR